MIIVIEQIITATILNSYNKSFASKQGREEYHGDTEIQRQRESIKEFLRTRTDHPTADVVYENMKLIYPNISLGTVYRNLSLLADLGEIKKLSSFAGADHFDGRTERHCHFMCIRCERIIDLESEGIHHIMDLAGENFKGKITDYSARFFGLCEDCLKETEGSSDSSK